MLYSIVHVQYTIEKLEHVHMQVFFCSMRNIMA